MGLLSGGPDQDLSVASGHPLTNTPGGTCRGQRWLPCPQDSPQQLATPLPPPQKAVSIGQGRALCGAGGQGSGTRGTGPMSLSH